jgi:crotonobetainyl-CoA:carnitine CoA-transferase CaiB-like acyl-CoA transferase
MKDAPLSGIRVVEVANYVAVPAAGTLLADLGADVIKVELPPKGEIYRRSRLRYAGYQTDFPEFPPFHMDNRGKRSIMLDLTNPDARAALLRMIERADIFITNLLPGRRRKYGVDPEALRARDPRLVVGAISGYGSGSTEEDRPAFDYAAYWARTGMMDLMRDEEVAPSLQRPAVGDHAAAVNLVCGILVALRVRDRTGEGAYVDVSLLQTGLHILGTDVSNALVTGETPHRHDRRKPPNPLWNSYPVAGGRWILFVMIEAERYWPRLCQALGHPEWQTDPRFADPFVRSAHAEDLVRELEAVLGSRTLEEWKPVLDAADLIWSPMLRVDEAIRDPLPRALGYVYEIEHPTAGRFETVGPPFRIAGMSLGARTGASPLHADARAILEDAGLSAEEIEKLL